jgi:hypothetical protein
VPATQKLAVGHDTVVAAVPADGIQSAELRPAGFVDTKTPPSGPPAATQNVVVGQDTDANPGPPPTMFQAAMPPVGCVDEKIAGL